MMKNIFKEVKELQAEYGNVRFSGKPLVLFCHNRKSVAVAFILLLLGECGLHRFYLGDKFSKLYGVFWLFIFLLICCADKFYGIYSSDFENLSPVWGWLCILIIIMYIADLFLIVPMVKRSNLLLKKNICNSIQKVRDAGPYAIWTYVAIILLFWRLLTCEMRIVSLAIIESLVVH